MLAVIRTRDGKKIKYPILGTFLLSLTKINTFESNSQKNIKRFLGDTW